MAFSHGIDGVVFLNGADVRRYFKSFAISREQDTAETTNFGSAGDKEFLAGMRGATVSLEGFYDGSTTTPVAIDKIVHDLLAANAANYLACMIDTDALGSHGYASVGGFDTSYEITTEVGDAAAISVEVQGQVLDRIHSLHAMAAETSSPDVEAQIDDGAAAPDDLGARGHLYVASTDGSIVVKVQHSADGGTGGTWADLITFAAATAKKVEVKEVAAGGTINRYIRAQWTRTGGTTATFFVGFRRAIVKATA